MNTLRTNFLTYLLAMEKRLAIKPADSIADIPNLTFESPEIEVLRKKFYRFLMLHIENQKEKYAALVQAMNDPNLTQAERIRLHERLEEFLGDYDKRGYDAVRNRYLDKRKK